MSMGPPLWDLCPLLLAYPRTLLPPTRACTECGYYIMRNIHWTNVPQTRLIVRTCDTLYLVQTCLSPVVPTAPELGTSKYNIIIPSAVEFDRTQLRLTSDSSDSDSSFVEGVKREGIFLFEFIEFVVDFIPEGHYYYDVNKYNNEKVI